MKRMRHTEIKQLAQGKASELVGIRALIEPGFETQPTGSKVYIHC